MSNKSYTLAGKALVRQKISHSGKKVIVFCGVFTHDISDLPDDGGDELMLCDVTIHPTLRAVDPPEASFSPDAFLESKELQNSKQWGNHGVDLSTRHAEGEEEDLSVPMPQQSKRHQDMMKAAEKYYLTLQQAKQAPPEEIEQLKGELDEAMAPFSDNAAYHAFLKMEREATGLGDKERDDKNER